MTCTNGCGKYPRAWRLRAPVLCVAAVFTTDRTAHLAITGGRCNDLPRWEGNLYALTRLYTTTFELVKTLLLVIILLCVWR
jgi:hypothetical protein